MKYVKNYIILIFILAISSVSIYITQNLIFHDPKDTIFYLLQDLAFVPVQAIVVTLILDRLINIIEKHNKLKKINVIISAFFADAGTAILFALAMQNENNHEFRELYNKDELTKANPKAIKSKVNEFKYKIRITPEKLEKLKPILAEKKSNMINMLENSNLLEHDSFTDMLWSVFHVADELQNRENLSGLSNEDLAHLSSDVLRAYKMIIIEWVYYIKYLMEEYPYLYLLAIKKNPFSDKVTL